MTGVIAKLPVAPHPLPPLPQLTTTELARYVTDLQQALTGNLSESDRQTVLARLGNAYAENGTRDGSAAAPLSQVTYSHAAS